MMTDVPVAATSVDPIQTGPPTHKVVIVNGSPSMADQFESVLNEGHYNVVFVESSARAYSQIKRVKPELVVLCVQTDGDGLQVLSMLKLDKDTREIPVFTCTVRGDEPDLALEDDDALEPGVFAGRKPALLMN